MADKGRVEAHKWAESNATVKHVFLAYVLQHVG